eukprot:s3487_g3.t1
MLWCLAHFLVNLFRKAFDERLITQLSRFGQQYADIGALVYRQVMGATSTAWNNKTGEAWPFMKEISSDGDVSTVDVIFPAFPLFLHAAPEFFRKLLIPLMVYSVNGTAAYGPVVAKSLDSLTCVASRCLTPRDDSQAPFLCKRMDVKYDLPWAPHHLGTWPICDLPSKRQEQMPVEESGNMLIMIAALAQKQGSNSTAWLKSYWPVLFTWADFLINSLPDPGKQLCTDDFEGPNPHNVNLAAKGIVALGAFAELLQLDGQVPAAQKFRGLAEGFAKKWVEMAKSGWKERGDHFRLFPESVFEQETAEYERHRNAFGIPLDDRHQYTKADWSIWSAAFGTKAHFQATVRDLWQFASSTPDRVPFTDWFDTKTGKQQGFRARPVMGGLFIGLVMPSGSFRVLEATTVVDWNRQVQSVRQAQSNGLTLTFEGATC